MELKVRSATPDDVEALCQTFFSSFGNETIATRCFPSTAASSWHFWRKNMADDLQALGTHFIVVDDVSTVPPTMAAFGQWRFMASGADIQQPPSKSEWPEDGDQELAALFFDDMWRKHKDIMGDRPHWYLELLSTRNEYQRKGIGRILLQWGIDKADADGLECYLGSTPQGKGLYEKFGFKEVKEAGNFTLDGVVIETYMRRDKQRE